MSGLAGKIGDFMPASVKADGGRGVDRVSNARAIGDDFQQRMHASMSRPESRDGTARTAAAQLVASAFVMPVLEAMREDPLASNDGPFAPGTAEKRFGPLLDQQFADRITSAANFQLIDAIVSRYPEISAATASRMGGQKEAIDVEG